MTQRHLKGAEAQSPWHVLTVLPVLPAGVATWQLALFLCAARLLLHWLARAAETASERDASEEASLRKTLLQSLETLNAAMTVAGRKPALEHLQVMQDAFDEAMYAWTGVGPISPRNEYATHTGVRLHG